MPSHVVRRSWSTTTRPYFPISTPAAARPISPLLASRPPEYSSRSMRSASFFCPSCAPSSTTCTRPSERSSTKLMGRAVVSKTCTRSRWSRRRSRRRRSPARKGRKPSSAQSRLTPTPSRASTVAYSNAMTPLPMMATARGSSLMLDMPLESVTPLASQGTRTRCSPTVSGLAARDPVAMQMRFAGSSTQCVGRQTRTLNWPHSSFGRICVPPMKRSTPAER
mmetsp:Transcript_26368/g.82116  ORF Transcript_26368/g.82116 Transcript_26368/m.82116 type:complete len:222 (-) Transcript_26368:203-868(-)